MVICTPIFTRLLTKEEFSKFAIFQSWQVIFVVFATLNVTNYATAKALVKFKDDRNVFILSAQSLLFTLSLLTFGVYCVVKFVYGGLNQLPFWIMILMFFDIISMGLFTFWSQIERFNNKYKALVFVSIFTGVLSPAIALILIVFSDTLELDRSWSRILGWVIANGIIAIVLFGIITKRSHKLFSVKYWKYCLFYCLPLIPHFLTAAFLQRIGQLVVDKYAGAAMAGVFALANSLAMLMLVFNDAFTKTIVPYTYQKLSDNKANEINSPVKFSLVFIASLDVVMTLVAPEIVTIFAGAAYKEAIYAIPPLVAVCYFGFLYNTFANIEYYYEETVYVSAASVLAGVLIVILNFTLVPKFGFLASAYASLISYIAFAWLHYYFMKKTIKKHRKGQSVYDNKFIFSVSVALVLSILFIPLLYQWNIVRYVIIILACCWILIYRKQLLMSLKSVLTGGKQHE